MKDIIISSLYQTLLQGIIVIQLIYIVDLFLERQKLSLKRIFYGILFLVTLYILSLRFLRETGVYIIINCIVICCILYTGKILHKSLCIIVALGIIGIAEMLNQAFIDQFIREFLSNDKWEKLILQLGSMILILVFIIIIKNQSFLRKHKQIYEEIPKRTIVALSTLALFSIGIFAMGMLIYSGKMHAAYNRIFLCIIMIGAIILDLSLLVIINHSTQVGYYKKLNLVIEQQLNNQLNYYERLEEVNQETRALKHDMRNHMLVINNLLKNGEMEELKSYVRDITQSVSVNERIIQTGNPIVDAILNEKYRNACDNQISIDVDLKLGKDIGIHAIDICAILSNSVDNAIEASRKIEEKDKREIKIIGRINQGYLIIQVINRVNEEVMIKNNAIKTSKQDKRHHGHGISNIRNSVAKYKGEFNLSLKEQYFMLEVVINTSCVGK